MAIYEINRVSGDAISTRIANAVVRFVYRLIDEHHARATEKALSKLSDHELYDIGLSRHDIKRVSNRA